MSFAVLSSRVRGLITEEIPKKWLYNVFNPLRVPYPEVNLEHPLQQMDFFVYSGRIDRAAFSDGPRNCYRAEDNRATISPVISM